MMKTKSPRSTRSSPATARPESSSAGARNSPSLLKYALTQSVRSKRRGQSGKLMHDLKKSQVFKV